jgi:hypothetical protein
VLEANHSNRLAELERELAELREQQAGWYVMDVGELATGGLRVKFGNRANGEIKTGIFMRWISQRDRLAGE